MFKINCTASKNADEILLNIFKDFIQELNRANKSAAILPWTSLHRSHGNISKASEALKNTKSYGYISIAFTLADHQICNSLHTQVCILVTINLWQILIKKCNFGYRMVTTDCFIKCFKLRTAQKSDGSYIPQR
jgi:hypothetical protein